MLTTDRLLLRQMEITDTAAVFRYRSDKAANCYQGWVPETMADVRRFIQGRLAGTINVTGTWFQLVMVVKESGMLVGDIGLHFPDNRQVETGCTLDKAYQGKGYATEALKMILSYLFHDLDKHRVTASVDPKNLSSVRLVERLGFRREAHFKKSIWMNGEWADDVIYAILQEEWNCTVQG